MLYEKKFLNETKNHNPPPFKLNGRSLTYMYIYMTAHVQALLKKKLVFSKLLCLFWSLITFFYSRKWYYTNQWARFSTCRTSCTSRISVRVSNYICFNSHWRLSFSYYFSSEVWQLENNGCTCKCILQKVCLYML